MGRQYAALGGYVCETGARSYPTLFGYVAETSGAGTQTITGALFTNSNSFFASTISASATIAGALFSNANSFFGASVSQSGVQTITGSLYANDNTFFGSEVTSQSDFRATSSGTGYAHKTLSQIHREKQEELARVQRQAKKAVASVIQAPGILSGDLTTIVRQEVETVPQSWLTPELIDFIVKRIEAQFRRAFIRKQQEDDDDDDDAFLLVA